MPATHLRIASPDDADGLGVVHVTSWQETYAGIMPDEMLKNLSSESRAAIWRRIITGNATSPETTVWVAEAAQGIVGFGSCGKQRDIGLADCGFDGEISAIYILRSFQRSGLGRSIMNSLVKTLHNRGHKAATLWVLKANDPARAFYENLGGAIVGEKKDIRPNGTLVEVAYGWRGLAFLVF